MEFSTTILQIILCFPMCIGCDELSTIEHILLTCSDLTEIRERHFTAQSLRVLYEDIPPF